jgi:hypothetical protein
MSKHITVVFHTTAKGQPHFHLVQYLSYAKYLQGEAEPKILPRATYIRARIYNQPTEYCHSRSRKAFATSLKAKTQKHKT